MKQLLNNKWAWAVAILVLLNIASLSTVWAVSCNRMRKHSFRERGHFMHKGMGDFLSQELQLNETQEKAFEELRQAHFKSLDSAFGKMQKLRAELVQNLGKTETEVNPIFLEIAAQEAEIQRITFAHFNKMYALCNDAQKKLLKEKLVAITTRKGGGFMGRGPRHHGMHPTMPSPPTQDEGEDELPPPPNR
jgi:hypothetical protein